MNWRRKQTAHYWKHDGQWPTKWNGVKTLHHVTDEQECRHLLQRVSKSERVEYLLHKDWFQWTALHVMALRGRSDIAEIALQSLDSQEDRVKIVTCGMRNGGETALHWACSVGMVRLLLDTLSPELVQRYIRHLDGTQRSAAHYAVIDKRPDIFQELWCRSNMETREQLIFVKDGLGITLIMYAAHANDANTINLILEHSNKPDYYHDLFRIGHPTTINSVILPLIAHQRFSLIAEILHRITIQQRRNLLSIENNRGISALKLSTLPPHLIRNNMPRLVGNYDYFCLYNRFDKIQCSVDMHSYLRHFTYEMSLTSQAPATESSLQVRALCSYQNQSSFNGKVSTEVLYIELSQQLCTSSSFIGSHKISDIQVHVFQPHCHRLHKPYKFT